MRSRVSIETERLRLRPLVAERLGMSPMREDELDGVPLVVWAIRPNGS